MFTYTARFLEKV